MGTTKGIHEGVPSGHRSQVIRHDMTLKDPKFGVTMGGLLVDFVGRLCSAGDMTPPTAPEKTTAYEAWAGNDG
jgi:hypothetical protein